MSDITTSNYISAPITFDQFIGNTQVKQILSDNIAVTLKKGSAFPNVLLTGASGCGKTSLISALAAKLGVQLVELNCGNGGVNLVNTLLKMPDKGILLLDEVHSLDPASIESILYRYIDEGKIFLRFQDGRIEPFEVGKRIVIVAATNMIDQLDTPFINRFDLNLKLKSYTHQEMCDILSNNLKSLNVSVDAISILANATRYVPRQAVLMSKTIKDYALLNDLTTITITDMKQALSNLGIDEYGLTEDDRDYIKLLHFTMNNAPTGINTICGILNDSKKNIESREIHLIKEGLIIKGGRGRQLSSKGLRMAMSME